MRGISIVYEFFALICGHIFAAALRPNIVFVITGAAGHQIDSDYAVVTQLP